MEKPIAEGQWIRHARFGMGVTTSSTESRTTIDFQEHGVKTFVTHMLEADLVAPPANATTSRRRSKSSAKA